MNDQSSGQGQTPSSPAAQGGELRRDRKSLREAARNETRRSVLGRRAAEAAPDESAAVESALPTSAFAAPVSASPQFSPAPTAPVAPPVSATPPVPTAAPASGELSFATATPPVVEQSFPSTPSFAPAPAEQPISAETVAQADPPPPSVPLYSPAPPAVPSVPVSTYATSLPAAFAPAEPTNSGEPSGYGASRSNGEGSESVSSHGESSFDSATLGFAELGIDVPGATTATTVVPEPIASGPALATSGDSDVEARGQGDQAQSQYDDFATRSFAPPAPRVTPAFGSESFETPSLDEYFTTQDTHDEPSSTSHLTPQSFEDAPFGGSGSERRFRSATGELPLAFETGETSGFATSPTVSPNIHVGAAPASSAAFGVPPAGGGAQGGYSDTSTGAHPVLGVLSPAVPETPRELQIFDGAALAAAVVVPPVGFVLGLVALRRGRETRGWASKLARAAVAVSLVMTVVFGIGAGLLWADGQRRAAADQESADAAAAHDAIVAESAEFCAALAASPQVYGSDDAEFGWPAYSGDENAYFAEVGGYGALWQSLVPIAPAAISEQVAAISARVDGIVSVASSLPNVNRAGNVLDLTSKDDISTVGTFVADYCQ